ncbi:MAG: gliding motility-associated C-terminal domain-containing protein [Pedobacter sp.]|nr:MAG: gliding motility-associated C-terminal domain-containing protein [Pedobacter sp.]
MTAQQGANLYGGFTDMFIVRYTPTMEIPVTNNNATAPVLADLCPGVDPGVIIGSIPVGDNYTYQWQQSLDNKTFADITGMVSKDFDPPVISATTYYRRRLITSECAVLNVSNVITLTLLEPASLNTITAPAVNSFCNAGNAALIRGSVPRAVGNIDYQWQQSTDNISFTNISGAIEKEYDPPSAGVTTYYRRLITNSPCNVGTPSNTVIITVISTPMPTVSAEQTVCIGDGVTLIATGGIRYSWSPATGLSATDIASPTAKPSITTNYTVTVNVGADMEILKGDKVQLNAQVSDVEGATYSWTPTTYLDNPTVANPMASPAEHITYRLTIKSANGCFEVSDDLAINVREKLIMPNSFTPNGDGINDVLVIPGLDSYKQSTFTIFDRNAQPVFKSLAYPKPWDGTHNGTPLPVGTYYYKIELNNYDHKRLSGYIFLIK